MTREPDAEPRQSADADPAEVDAPLAAAHGTIGARVRSALSGIPAPVRKVLVIVAGSVLIIIGLALVVLPGALMVRVVF
ncbi:MAG: hypothetical protein RLZ55_1507 [Actinomycetota bacterium]